MLYGLREIGCGLRPCTGRSLDFHAFGVGEIRVRLTRCDFCLTRCWKIHGDVPGVLFEQGLVSRMEAGLQKEKGRGSDRGWRCRNHHTQGEVALRLRAYGRDGEHVSGCR